MEFPGTVEDWDILPAELFADAEAKIREGKGVAHAELMALIRDNGRIQDDWRMALASQDILEYRQDSRLFGVENRHPELTFVYQMWGKDIAFKKNSTTTVWSDVRTMIQERVITVQHESGEYLGNAEVANLLDEYAADKDAVETSLRWAIVIGDSKGFELHLQLLPGSVEELNGKPTLKR
jgi:hypothetical protein